MITKAFERTLGVFVLSLLAACVFLCAGCSAGSSSGASSVSSASGASSASSSNAFNSDGLSSVASSSEVPEAKPASLDLAKEADRVMLNQTLSWMAQAYSETEGPSVNLSDPNNQVRFAITYLGINDPEFCEFGDYTDIVGSGAAADGSTNARMSELAADIISDTYFGVIPDYSALDGAYKKADGYVYFSVTAPVGQTAYYSVADEITLLGDGRYSVAFETFSNGMPYVAHDDSFYAKNAEQMMAALGVDAPRWSGTAVVRALEREGGKWVVFESYDFGVPEAEATVITTPYYTITIPAGWPEWYQGQPTYTVNEELRMVEGGPDLGIGCTTDVIFGDEAFHVTCFTDNWGAQGDYVAELVGTPSNLPGWRVIAYTARSAARGDIPSALSGYIDEFVSFITLA